VFAADANRVWAVGSGRYGFIMESEDGGSTWDYQNPSQSIRSFSRVFFTDRQYGWILGAGNVLLRTTDGGTNWSPRNVDTPNRLQSLFFVDRMNGWLCGDAGAVLHSTDGGQSWSPQPSGTRSTLRAVRFVNDQIGWAAGDNGTILKTRTGGLLDPSTIWKNILSPTLYQNFPNPFGQSTTIRFVLPEPGRVTLSVYDLLGRKVAVLLDEVRLAGLHEKAWAPEGKASGLYFVRFETATVRRTIKMVKIQ
jgi:photosystem II stability/assembly factor-like uncharacterized protein